MTTTTATSAATAAELAQRLNLKTLNMGCGEANVTCGYTGDLLSRVMVRAPKGCAWVTIMTNVNAAAVAEMVGAACVILAEGVQPDAELLGAAQRRGINLFSCENDAFSICRLIAEVLTPQGSEHEYSE